MPVSINPNTPSILSYSRIEPRTRIPDLEVSLSNPVYDGMWMLTQQWRLGEFRGHDGGSIVNSRIHTQSSRLNRFQCQNSLTEGYDVAEAPLEAVAERLPVSFDLVTRLQMGRHFLRLVRANGYFNDALFIAGFPIQQPITPEGLSNKQAQSVRATAAGRAVDGADLYEFLKTHTATGLGVIGFANISAVNGAIAEFKTWFNSVYYQPETTGNSWSAPHLEYQFSVSAPGSSNTTQTVLKADEYNGSSIDWYSADLTESESAVLTETPTDNELDTGAITDEPLDYIPSAITFKGMPKKRWWEFEDRNHDIGQVPSKKNDLIKMLVTDFGLIYSNDWFVIPHEVEAGTLTEILGLVAIDSFGRQTLIKRAGSGVDEDWHKWNLFTLNRRGNDAVAADERLFIPPSLPQSPDNHVFERIVLLRDEMANMVWGVEEIISDELGTGVNGKEAYNHLLDYLRLNLPAPLAMPAGSYIGNEATIAYKLSSTVPESWIPFIPAQTGNADRSVMFQRATMQRTIDGVNTGELVRPRTSVLSFGIAEVPANSVPYFINEEEISRSGLIITTSFQRTRWYDGRIVTWKGYSKQIGRGEGSSGLKYDLLTQKPIDSAEVTSFLTQEDTGRIRLEDNTGNLIQ
ncbi:MAG: hypothetical protein M3R17_10160 [Bacteroidota bacterium]|nr:hypothetical protein [Bacteroidota bacterium]